MVCYLCLQHNDHNVVSSSLETLDILLKHSNLFDFDQVMISTEPGCVEDSRVSQALRKGNSKDDGPRLLFLELGFPSQWQLPTVVRRHSFVVAARRIEHGHLDDRRKAHISSQTGRTTDFQVSVRLVHSRKHIACRRYILKTDGAVKSDEESRVSIKCATLTCLSHLATIDPFAFFDSFDYPTESELLFFPRPWTHDSPLSSSQLSPTCCPYASTAIRIYEEHSPIFWLN